MDMSGPQRSGRPPPRRSRKHQYALSARPCDRVEFWLNKLALLLLFFGVPTAAFIMALAAYTSQMQTMHVQVAQRYQVTARVTTNAMSAVPAQNDDLEGTAPVAWTTKGGAERMGSVSVNPGTKKGAAVRIWVNSAGAVTSAPLTHVAVTRNSWSAGLATAGAVSITVLGIRTGIRWTIERRRYAQWEKEWALFEPRWSARPRG